MYVGGMFCVRCRHIYVDDLIIWKTGRCKETFFYDNFNDQIFGIFVFLFQNGGAFLIQANTSKRQKLQEDGNTSVFESVEVGFYDL